MGQISSGSLTIVDVTDGAPGLNNTTVFLYQRAVNAPDKPTGNLTYTFATATVTGSLDGWVQNINSLTGSNPIWMIAAVASSNGSTDVIEPSEWAGPIKMAQNGQDGQPGTNGTNGLNQATVFIYKRGDSATTPSSVTYTFATGGFTVPSGWSKTIPTTPKGKPCWVTSAIAIGAEATAELNWATPSVLVEDGSDGISPIVTATENGVKIVDADGNETTITNGADGISYYTFVRYSQNANGSGYVVTPTSETIYIGVYTGTESSPPVYSDAGWKWSRYVGADGQPGTPGTQGPQGVSVTATRELYYLKTNSTGPSPIDNANQIHNTDDVNQWTSVVPTYIGSGKYYTCIETNLSTGNPVWSTPIENKGLTDANVNAANAIEIARGVKQHFFWVATDKSENVPAGAYVAEQSEESFYSSPTKGNILTRSDGIWIRNGADKLATLQGSGLTFLVPTGTYKGQTSVSLNGSGLTFYNIGSSNSAAATLASDGLQITNGSIVLGTTSGTAAGNVTLSNQNFTRSINGTSHNNLRFAIGSKFGVANDGTLYSSGLDSVVSRVDDIEDWEIGGRNFIRNTGAFNGWTNCGGGTAGTFDTDNGIFTYPATTADGWTEIRPNANVPYNYVRNEKVTLSAEVKGTNGQSLSVMVNPYVSATTAGDRAKYRNVYLDTDGGSTALSTVTADGTWQKVYATVTINDAFFTSGSATVDFDSCYFGVRAARHNTNHNAYSIRHIKIEKGNKATDWSPAPEDVSASISELSTSITANEEAIKLEASRRESAVNMLLDSDAPSLTKINAPDNRGWGNWVSSSDANYCTASFVEMENSPLTNVTYAAKFVATSGHTGTVGRGLVFYASNSMTNLPLKVGTKYTASCWARCTSGSGNVAIYGRVKSGGGKTFLNKELTSEWKYYTCTVELESTPDYNKIYFYGVFPANTAGTVEICGFKLVAGENIEAYSTQILQTADNVLIKATKNYSKDSSLTDAQNGGKAAIQSLINVAPEGVQISADKVNITGTTIFNAVDSDASAKAAMLNSEIEIGGRNLVLGTSDQWVTTSITDGTNKSVAIANTDKFFIATIPDVQVGDVIQISFDIKFGSNWGATGTGTKHSRIQGTSNYSTWASITMTGGTKEERLEEIMASSSREGHVNTYFKVTSTMIDGSGDQRPRITIRFDYYSGDVSIKCVKVEKASTPSNWTPAPEDVDGAITAVNNKATAYRGTLNARTDGVITVNSTGFVLATGATISVYFSGSSNYAGKLTLNVNSTGAKDVWVGDLVTSDTNRLLWHYGSTITFTYDGTRWRVVDSPGTFYGSTCSTAAGTAAKVTNIPSGVIFRGCTIEAPMSNANTSTSAALHIGNSANDATVLTGNILYGTGSTVPTQSNGYSWLANMSVIFKYDGKYWRTGNQTIIDGGHILTGTISADRIGANSITIGKIASSIQNSLNWYATCDTAAATTAKVATITPATTEFSLSAGVSVNVKFTNTNSGAVGSITLNVNNTGAKNIKYVNNKAISNIPAADYIVGNVTYQFVYDGTYWVIQNLNYNSDTYDRKRISNAVIVAENITQYCIAGRSAEPNVTGHKKLVANLDIDLTFPICYLNQANINDQSYAVASGGTTTNFYTAYPSVNLQNTKASWTGTNRAMCYIKGTLTGQKFKVHSDIFTTTIPNSDDGFAYIPIGLLYSTYQVNFSCDNSIYGYKNGAFGPLANREASAAQATANAAAPKSSAVAEEQYIYISKASGTTSVNGTTTWVTENKDKQNTWSTKRPTYNSSYPVLFIAKQKKVVSGTVTCTTPVKDDTTTVIDGGHITTGTIDTNRLNAATIKSNIVQTTDLNANKITSGTLDAARIGANSITADKISIGAIEEYENILLDSDAPTMTKVKASYDRYWSDGGNNKIVCSNFSLTDAPEQGLKYGRRFVYDGSVATNNYFRAYAFYSTNDNVIPFVPNQTYTATWWARCTSGSGRTQFYYSKGDGATGAASGTIYTLTSYWKKYTYSFTFGSALNTNYNRIWFRALFPTSTAGTVEICGCKLVVGADAESYITRIDNNGIRIHPSSTESNSVVINGSGMEVFKGGTGSANSVAKYGDTSRVGKESGFHVVTNPTDITFKDGTNADIVTFGTRTVNGYKYTDIDSGYSRIGLKEGDDYSDSHVSLSVFAQGSSEEYGWSAYLEGSGGLKVRNNYTYEGTTINYNVKTSSVICGGITITNRIWWSEGVEEVERNFGTDVITGQKNDGTAQGYIFQWKSGNVTSNPSGLINLSSAFGIDYNNAAGITVNCVTSNYKVSGVTAWNGAWYGILSQFNSAAVVPNTTVNLVVSWFRGWSPSA